MQPTVHTEPLCWYYALYILHQAIMLQTWYQLSQAKG